MTFYMVTTQVAADTGGGSQDITTAKLSGITPVGVIFTWGLGTANGTPVVDLSGGIGAATGTTNEWAHNFTDEDNVSTTDTSRELANTACIYLLNPGSTSSIVGAAEFTAFISGGVRINWTTSPSAAYLISVTFIAGTDAQCHAGTFTAADAVDATTDVTAPGFEPEALILGSGGFTVNTGTGGLWSAIGFAVNDGADTQCCKFWYSENGAATSNTNGSATSTYATGQYTSSYIWAGLIGGFDADGFTCTTKESSSGGSEDVGYIAISSTGTRSWTLESITSPTSTGSQAYSGFGFTPEYIATIGTLHDILDQNESNGQAGSSAFGMADGTDDLVVAWTSEDGQGTTDTQSLADDNWLTVPQNDGTDELIATLTSFDSDGITTNWTAVDGSLAYYQFILAVGATGAGPGFVGLYGDTLYGEITPTDDTILEVQKTLYGEIQPVESDFIFEVQKTFTGEITPSGSLTIVSSGVREEDVKEDFLMYIEQVKFTEPDGLQLIGGDDDRLEVFLAQQGIKNVEDVKTEVDTNNPPNKPSTSSGGTNIEGTYDTLYPGCPTPIGGIIMYSGDLAGLSSCWQLCDGSNDYNSYPVPDLRDKFIVGSENTYAQGDTGGAATIDIQHNHGPGTLGTDSDAHTHGPGTLNTDSDTHSHTAGGSTKWPDIVVGASSDNVTVPTTGSPNTSVATANHNHTIGGPTPSDSHDHNVDSGITASDSHSHSVNSGLTANALSATQDILPPYYALAFIIRVE